MKRVEFMLRLVAEVPDAVDVDKVQRDCVWVDEETVSARLVEKT